MVQKIATIILSFVASAFGQTVVTSTIGSAVGRDYSTIAAWEAATDNDLVTANEIQVGEIYNDSVFSGSDIIIDGAVVDNTRYRKLTVAATDRHDGTEGSGARYNITVSYSSSGIDILDIGGKFILEWLEIYSSDSTVNCRYGVNAENSRSILRYLLIHDIGRVGISNSALITGYNTDNADTVEVYNCILYDGQSQGIQMVYPMKIRNVTIYNCKDYGIMTFGTNDSGHEGKNIISIGNSTADFESGIFDTASNNLSSDASAPGTNRLTNKTAANQFVDSGWPPDLHLKSTADAKDAGTTISEITDDIDGDSRPQGSAYDIGADEYVSSAPSSNPKSPKKIRPQWWGALFDLPWLRGLF